MEVLELDDHPFFIASQFHPEFRSRPNPPRRSTGGWWRRRWRGGFDSGGALRQDSIAFRGSKTISVTQRLIAAAVGSRLIYSEQA